MISAQKSLRSSHKDSLRNWLRNYFRKNVNTANDRREKTRKATHTHTHIKDFPLYLVSLRRFVLKGFVYGLSLRVLYFPHGSSQRKFPSAYPERYPQGLSLRKVYNIQREREREREGEGGIEREREIERERGCLTSVSKEGREEGDDPKLS